MTNKPRVMDVVKAVGISKGHASNILSGADDPSRSLAIRIYRATGWRHPAIEHLSTKQIRAFEDLEAADLKKAS